MSENNGDTTKPRVAVLGGKLQCFYPTTSSYKLRKHATCVIVMLKPVTVDISHRR